MTLPALFLALSMASGTLTPTAPRAPLQAPPANPIGTAVLAFKERVHTYLELHHDAESKVAKQTETSNPAQVLDREAALGAMIRRLRPTAKEGDVFGADFLAILTKEVHDDFRGRAAADRKALIQELPASTRIGVNMTYPAALPLATFPAQLLRKLPALPPELEYRIVGRHIVLRDVGGNVIVDIARNIVPTIPS